MKNRILLPFKYKENNQEKYVQAMKVAAFTNADLILFTCVPSHYNDAEIDKVYENFLELNGFFQSFFGEWKKPGFKIERIIQRGNFGERLAEYLNNSQSIDLVVT